MQLLVYTIYYMVSYLALIELQITKILNNILQYFSFFNFGTFVGQINSRMWLGPFGGVKRAQ